MQPSQDTSSHFNSIFNPIQTPLFGGDLGRIDPLTTKALEMENGPSSEGRDPSGFLSEIIGAPVTVKLNSGVVYKGMVHFAKAGTHRQLTLLWLQGNSSRLMDT